MPIERIDDSGIHDAVTLLRKVASVHPHGEAFVEGDVRLTFGRWDRAADAVAARFLSLGVGRGDVVALMLPSSADYAVCYQAAMRLGAITSGVNPRLGRREVASIFERTTPRVTVIDPKAAVAPEGGVDAVIERAELADVVAGRGAPATFPTLGADDPVAIVWTSGTTGVPKGAVFDHGCLRAMVEGAGVLSAPGDRRLSPLPFAHVGYMTRVWDELVHVITTVILPTPWRAADHLRLIEGERITVGQGVPTQWQLVLDSPAIATTDYSSLRITSSGAARVPAELVRAMRLTFGVPVVVRYTSTEACISTGTTLEDGDEVVATTVGRASPGVSLRIADADEAGVGEVLVRSRAAMRGYWKQPSSDVIDGAGWVHTGDLGRLDGLGNLVLVGRVVEMYTRGGYNVYPAEVEAVLGAHPAVAQVAVVGVADPVLGSVGVACVVAGEAVGAAELRAWCQGQLADYKAPDRVVFMDHLPLTSMAKVDKRALARQVEGDR